MTSQLASQLQRLQQRPSNKHLSVSFLFEKGDARSFTREQIHQLAISGLQTLVVVDNRFHAFSEPLFNGQRTRLERARLSAGENAQIDRQLDHLLTLLSPHLFLTAAQQVFEYLVRVYEVHVFNVTAVLRAFLPYHDHNLFARALLLLDLRDTGFQFLVTNQERGAPLLREHLILAAAESRKALRLVCSTMAFSVRYKVHNNAANALFAAVAVGLSTHAEADALWRVLVPFVIEFLSSGAGGSDLGNTGTALAIDDDDMAPLGAEEEIRGNTSKRSGAEPENREAVCTALVVLASWCCEARFTTPMLSALMKPLLRFLELGTSSRPVVPLADLLQLLDLLFTTQQAAIQELPFASQLASLVEMPWEQWMPLLTDTFARREASHPHVPLRTLITVLLQYALGRLAVAQSLEVVPRAVRVFLELAAEALPLSHPLTKFYLKEVIAYDAKHTTADAPETDHRVTSDSSSAFLDRITVALEGRYQRAFDETLAELLQTSPATAATDERAAATQEAKKAASEAAVRFLSRHLGGARYQVLTVATRSHATERLPLFACLLHPLPQVRQTALAALRGASLSSLCATSRRTGGAAPEGASMSVDEEGETTTPRDVHYSPEAKGSVLELLAHVAEFEADGDTALRVVEVCAEVLNQLRGGLSATGTRKGKTTKAPRAEEAMPDADFCASASCLLVRALHRLAVVHSGAVREAYLEKILSAFLGSMDGTASGEAASARVRACMVYHTVQLYLLSAHDTNNAGCDAKHVGLSLAAKAGATLQEAYATLKPRQDAVSATELFAFEVPTSVLPVESSTRAAGSRRGKAAASSSSSDDDDDDKADATRAANKGKLEASAGAVPVLDVWSCAAVLVDAWTEAEYQLPRLRVRIEELARASASVSTSAEHMTQTDATELELCLALASKLAAEPTAGAAELQTFLVGQGDAFGAATTTTATTNKDDDDEGSDATTHTLRRRGYLGLCVATQRGAARQMLSSESRVAVGRGVQNSALAADFTPSDRLTRRLAAVSQTAVTRWLSKASASATTVKTVLRLLGLLGAALPPLALHPDLVAPALFELVALASDHATATASRTRLYPVDWFYLVYDAITRPTKLVSAEKTTAPPRAALALVLLLPLWAPPSQRTPLLQMLQSALLQDSGKQASASSAARLLHAAMQNKALGLSMTTVSSVIESMAREESRFRLTNAAADLVAQFLAEPTVVVHTPEEGEGVPLALRHVIPYTLAADVLTYFFPTLDRAEEKSHGKSAAAATGSARLNLAVVLPRVLSLLPSTATDAGESKRSKRAKENQSGRGAVGEVPMEAVQFLDVVCRRTELAPREGPTLAAPLEQDPALSLCTALLRTPFLTARSHGSAARTYPVYRLALTLLATAMQRGRLEDEAAAAHQSGRNPLIFTTKSAKATRDTSSPSAKASASMETYLEQVVAQLRPLILGSVASIGSDVATLCVGTIGGFNRIFVPFLNALSQGGGGSATELVAGEVTPLEVLLELTRALVPVSATTASQLNESAVATDENRESTAANRLADTRWQPASHCALTNALTFAHAMTILDLVSATVSSPSTTARWAKTQTHLQCLDVLSALLQASPAIVFDDDEEDDGSLFALVHAILDRFPVSEMCDLLSPDTTESGATAPGGAGLATIEGSHRLVTPYVQRVLQLLHDLTDICEHRSSALSEHNPQNAFKVRSTLIKQSLLVMATLLTSGASSTDASTDMGDGEEADLSRARIDVITELLRALAPLLSLRGFAARGAVSTGSGDATEGVNAFLHIPLAALLIRLESVEKTEALRYKSAVEVCQEVLGSFDIHTQIVCLSQLMRLVVDPAAQLAAEATNEEPPAELDAAKEAERLATDETIHLLRRMVKPNQIINRQEALLSLVNLSVKSDNFLGPFIELQHRSRRAGTNAHPSKAGTTDDGDEEDHEAATRKAEEGSHTSEECMQLLVSALETFAHYSDLNTQTADLTEGLPEGEYSDDKAYVMLLELLAGNALACVLAGINEPTFVSCLQRLLGDERTALQLKGLEVLLDRLHHSLPTVENTLTDEELEQHRRELRDPRKRLTLADLVRIKARPLTTKRSFSLYPLVETILRAAVRSVHAVTRGVVAVAENVRATSSSTSSLRLAMPLTALEAVFRLAQLAAACMEELIRIVGSGGSTQAEKTLLNTSRSRRVTEAMLAKAFGNKARVQEVHHTVDALCAEWMPQLSLSTQRLYQTPAASTSAATTTVTAAVRRPANAPSFSATAPTNDEQGAAHAPAGQFVVPAAAYTRLAEEGLLNVLTMLMTLLASTVQVMGVSFTAAHCLDVLNTNVAAAVFQVVELPSLVAQGASGSLLRRTTLSAFIRCYPACWQFSQPALPRVLFAATHLINVNDTETNYLSTELLAMLEALLEPQMFMEACADCLRGTPYVNVAVVVGAKAQNAALAAASPNAAAPQQTGRRRPTPQLRLLVATHSFHAFFQCVQRRVQSLNKEELARMPMLTDGTTPSDNFWLSALEALAVTSTMPPAEVLTPVLEAFTSFFLKFKPKHCNKFLRTICEWAFAVDAVEKKGAARRKSQRGADGSDSDTDGAAAAQQLSRTTLHRWLAFYALVNHLLEKLGSILDFGFPVLVPHVTTTLHTYCSAGTHPAKQHASLLALVLEGALSSVRLMAKAQTPGPDYDYSIPLEIFFATPEVFNALMPALVHQLTNLTLLQDDSHTYSFRAEHAVIPALRAFFACLHSSKLQSKTQAELARGLRHPSRLVRCQTLACLDGIYADGGEELASRIMAEVLPAVVELTEDRDSAVVEAARTMCTNLSHMTGQDVLYAMS